MSTNAAPKNYKPIVREQYEDLPYPPRDIGLEGTFFACCEPLTFESFNHFGWAGKRDLRKDGRILIAGCGTGDTAIHFAEQMLGHSGEVVALDLSSKSIEIAKARLAKRGLEKVVTFHHMSILDAPEAGLGEFDVIESSGVLHHLPDPNAGLEALAKLLKPDGLMGIMVYGQYGRLSIYLVQELMQRLMTEETPRSEKIAIARDFLNAIPVGHWLTVNNSQFMGDIRAPDGSGIYDLFLHSTDRAYTVPQLYDWVEGRGLQIMTIFGDLADESMYTPESYSASANINAIVAGKSRRERQAIAELMSGSIGKHFFFASKQEKTEAQPTDDMVISYASMQSIFVKDFIASFTAAFLTIPVGQRAEGPSRPVNDAPPLFLTHTPYATALMPLIDGTRTIGEIISAVVTLKGAKEEDVRRDLMTLYSEYRTRQMVFLRHRSIPAYADGVAICTRVKKYMGIA